MLPTLGVRAVYVASHRVDFRRSYDGLLAECYNLGVDPFGGDMVLFVGRNRRRIKILFADASGLWLASKRFSDGAMKTRFKFLNDPLVTEITTGELQMFCEGSAYQIDRRLDLQKLASPR